ncbi:MAG: hypothetical protein HKO80_06840 [Flavobacteriaceae bacterium]|nr:hypothetical protein [Flavobacteriaceae bacterium]
MIEKQAEISGLCELKMIDGNFIFIKCPKFELLSLTKGKNTGLSQATICIGESFNLSDADHISETYNLTGIQEGSAILEGELTFTGTGIPEEEWTKKKLISVSPYKSP